MKLKDKVALVTGAGRGIGQGIALVFAKEGADIAVNASHLSSAEGTAKAVRELGRKAIAIEADVSEADQVEKMVKKVIKEFGGIHILVNNVGGSLEELVPTLEQSLEKWDRMLETNLRDTYLCCREVGKWMVSHKTGKIINIASIVGMSGWPTWTAYGPAKAGVINMTMALAVEWGKYNINVNCIAPGFILTDLIKQFMAEGHYDVEALIKRTPLGRLGTPEDIGNAAVFLASEDAKQITGVTLPIDGGWTAYGYL